MNDNKDRDENRLLHERVKRMIERDSRELMDSIDSAVLFLITEVDIVFYDDSLRETILRPVTWDYEFDSADQIVAITSRGMAWLLEMNMQGELHGFDLIGPFNGELFKGK